MYATNIQHKIEQFLSSLSLTKQGFNAQRHKSLNPPFPKTIIEGLRKKKNRIPIASCHFFIKSVFFVTLRVVFILALVRFVLLSTLSHGYFQPANSFMETDLKDYLIQKKLPSDLSGLHKLTFSITLQQITQILFIIEVSQFAWVAEQSHRQTSYS